MSPDSVSHSSIYNYTVLHALQPPHMYMTLKRRPVPFTDIVNFVSFRGTLSVACILDFLSLCYFMVMASRFLLPAECIPLERLDIDSFFRDHLGLC